MEGCNCLQQWKDTDLVTGKYTEVRNGTCAQSEDGRLPWCYVDPKTCFGQLLLRNGYYWDNCYPDGTQRVTVLQLARPQQSPRHAPSEPAALAIQHFGRPHRNCSKCTHRKLL